MGRPQGLQPNLWKYPFDEQKRAKALAFVRARCQARYRNEDWTITEPEWMEQVWPDHLWLRRGRHSESLCLIRDNPNGAWSMDNIMIVTRRTQLAFQRGQPSMREIEPGIWDITGSTLEKWALNKAIQAKYR